MAPRRANGGFSACTAGGLTRRYSLELAVERQGVAALALASRPHQHSIATTIAGTIASSDGCAMPHILL